MGVALPDLTLGEFADRLGAVEPRDSLHRLFAHYEVLRLWAPRLSLVGPGTTSEVVERHYVESLAARPWIPQGGRVLDLGSGGGFPGLVLAGADPSLDATLVEARQRKWAFLEAARRAMSLSCRCLNARVELASRDLLPDSVDRITLRALRLEPSLLTMLAESLGPRGAIVFWAGREAPEIPPELRWVDELPLTGDHRRLLLAVPA